MVPLNRTPAKSRVQPRGTPHGPEIIASELRSRVYLFCKVAQVSYICGHLQILRKLVSKVMIPTQKLILCVVLEFIFYLTYLTNATTCHSSTYCAAMVAATPSANAAQHFVSPVHVGFAATDVPAIE